MKFFCIPPNNHLDLMTLGDSNYFCLAHHYASDPLYRDHFLQVRKNDPAAFILLDCGAAENSTVTQEVLLDIVTDLQPDEVIAPDVLFDKEKTLANFYSFLLAMHDQKLTDKTKIFACPQGETKDEWLQCYCMMLVNPDVSTIGLSKIAVPKCWNGATGDTLIAKSRNQCIAELNERGWLRKPLHLLGMGENDEFDFYLDNKTPNIRSSDSCYTVLAAINGISFADGNTTRIPTTNAYFDTLLTEEQIQLTKSNVYYLKNKYMDV